MTVNSLFAVSDLNMSSKQSPALNVLIQKYEGMSGVEEQRRSKVFRSTSRENPVEIVEFRNQYYKDRERASKRSSVQYQNVKGNIRKSSLYESFPGKIDGNRNSLNRSVKNTSFSFPPLNAFYGATVGVLTLFDCFNFLTPM